VKDAVRGKSVIGKVKSLRCVPGAYLCVPSRTNTQPGG